MAAPIGILVGGVALLQKFDLQTALGRRRPDDIRNKTHSPQCEVAASYGNLTPGAMRRMDEALKVCIQATIRAVDKAEDASWPTVLASMMTNPVLEYEQDRDVKRQDKYTVEKEQWFHCGYDPVIINEVELWFKKLINDDDIITDLRMDKDSMAKIVAETGAQIDSFGALFMKAEYIEQNVLDAGILRYPDLDHPYFKLYRLRLKAWRECRRVFQQQRDRNGIAGDFRCMQFKPRYEVIAKMSPEIREMAAAEAEELLRWEI